MPRISKVAPVAATVLALAGLGATGSAAAAKTLTAKLSGRAEVPRADPDARGTARVTTNVRRRRVCFDIRLSKVGKVQQGHIHAGRRGRQGNVVVALFAKPTRHPKGCARASRKVIRAINRHPGRYYVNVHNAAHPDGAARGQLRD